MSTHPGEVLQHITELQRKAEAGQAAANYTSAIKNYEQAITLLSELPPSENTPAAAELYLACATSRIAANQYPQAEHDLNRAIELAPVAIYRAQALIRRSDIRLRMGRAPAGELDA